MPNLTLTASPSVCSLQQTKNNTLTDTNISSGKYHSETVIIFIMYKDATLKEYV